jgi:hypothetical protein
MMLPKLHTVAEALAMWPEGARPTEKRFRALARRLGACRIEGHSFTLTDHDLQTIIEAMRPCSDLNENGTRHTSMSAAQSRGSESTRARERLSAGKPKHIGAAASPKSTTPRLSVISRSTPGVEP